MDERTLNVGLDMAMEFGPNWLKPIQERLGKKFPELNPLELDEYDRICREAMNFGHAQVVPCERESKGDRHAAFERFQTNVLARYAWVSRKNLDHLFSQGWYYAMKDGDL
jgi:hypothetical protein